MSRNHTQRPVDPGRTSVLPDADMGPPPERCVQAQSDPAIASVEATLEAARPHLGMDVAFVGRTLGGVREVRHVAAAAPDDQALGGSVEPLGDSYCGLIADGSLESAVPDATVHAKLRHMATTERLGIRAHLGTPIVLPDGTLYGALCCFSRSPDHALTDRDADVLRLLSSLIAQHIEQADRDGARRRALRADIRERCAGGQPTMLFQPIVSLASGEPCAYEALARFPNSVRSPDAWFADASEVGMGDMLEAQAVKAALGHLDAVPRHCYLAINISDRALCSDTVMAALRSVPLDRVVIELTEQQVFDDHVRLAQAMAVLRGAGARFSLDDVGAGYAGLERVLRLTPETIKLDRSLIRGLELDPARQALLAAVVRFAASVGADLVAEGVETRVQHESLRGLGLLYGQGYLFGRPAPLAQRDEPSRP